MEIDSEKVYFTDDERWAAQLPAMDAHGRIGGVSGELSPVAPLDRLEGLLEHVLDRSLKLGEEVMGCMVKAADANKADATNNASNVSYGLYHRTLEKENAVLEGIILELRTLRDLQLDGELDEPSGGTDTSGCGAVSRRPHLRIVE